MNLQLEITPGLSVNHAELKRLQTTLRGSVAKNKKVTATAVLGYLGVSRKAYGADSYEKVRTELTNAVS